MSTIKPLFNIMMNDFTLSIINTILSNHRIDADPATLLRQFYYNKNNTNNNNAANTNNSAGYGGYGGNTPTISPFTKHFFNRFIHNFISKGKINTLSTYNTNHETTSATNHDETTYNTNHETNDNVDITQTHSGVTGCPSGVLKGQGPFRSVKGRPSKPKIITIEKEHENETETHHKNIQDSFVTPNIYSKHNIHLITQPHELFEEPFDHEFDTLYHPVRTRNKRSFIYNGITLLIDNSNLLYKPYSPHTPFAIFNYSLHKITPL
jgi:hypothetical protein